MFILGLVIGIFCGGTAGLFIAALLVISHEDKPKRKG